MPSDDLSTTGIEVAIEELCCAHRDVGEALGLHIRRAVRDNFTSPNVVDRNMEPANVVDVIESVAIALSGLRESILPPGGEVQHQPDGTAQCVTEAVLSVAAGLFAVATSIDKLAAVREVE